MDRAARGTSRPRRTGLDEEVARELDHVAREARAVGGMAAEAQALESAAALSPSPDGRASRLLGAARAWRHAGRVAHARDLLEQALPLAGTETIRIEIRLEQGKNLLREREFRKAFDLLYAEATHARTESALAARLYSAAALAANVYEGGLSPLGFAEQALDLARGRGDAVELEALFAAVTARMARPVPPDDADVALVERASELLARPELRGGEEPHWIAYALAELERSDESRRLSDLAVAEARRAGDVWSLCYGLYARAASELAAGRVDAARSWVAEAAVPLAEQIGEPWRLVEATLPVSNQVEAARGNVDALVTEAGDTPLPPADLSVTRGRSLLARGRFEEAMEPLEQAHVALSGEGPRAWFRLLSLDLTEVYATSGQPAKAEAMAQEIAPSIESCHLVRPRAKLQRVRGLLVSEGRIDAVFRDRPATARRGSGSPRARPPRAELGRAARAQRTGPRRRAATSRTRSRASSRSARPAGLSEPAARSRRHPARFASRRRAARTR